jgi:hypothetical protein
MYHFLLNCSNNFNNQIRDMVNKSKNKLKRGHVLKFEIASLYIKFALLGCIFLLKT